MKRGEILLRRLTGFLISFVMAIGMLTTAVFAAGTATITIKKPDDFKVDWKDMEVNAYKVLTVNNPKASKDQWVYEADINFKNFFNIDTTASNGTVEEAFTGATVYLTYTGNHLQASDTEPTDEKYITLTGDKAKTLDATYGEADLISRLTGDNDGAGTSQNALLYTWLEKYIESNNSTASTINPSKTATANGSENSIVLDGLDDGYYALTFSKVPDGVSVKQGILVATSATVNLKAEELPLIKQVKPEDDKTNYAESATAELGEKLSYKITSKVPTLTDYSNLTLFEFTDTMIRQTTDISNFVLEIKGATVTKAGNQFKIGENVVATLTLNNYGEVQDPAYPDESSKTVPGQTFTLNFEIDVLKDYQGKDVTLTYQAALTGDAINVNPNNITLTYKNGPDTSELTSRTEVYTYGIEVQKTFSSTDKPYSGVTFKLFKDNNNSKGAQIALVGSAGIYNVPANGTTGSNDDLKLSTDGKLVITGLDEGTYWLEETNAPTGFTKADLIKIVLCAETDNKESLDKDNSTAKYNGTETGEDLLTTVTTQTTTNISLGQFKVFNQKGFNLPQTGGAGTWMLTIGGIVLIAAAGILYFASKNKVDA